VGRLPDRKAGDGRMPVPGWSGEYEWRGLRPADDNPFLLDPTGGVVLNANNRPVDRATETGWEGEWDPGFRYAYLRAALASVNGADVARFRSLQTDVTSLPVQRFRASFPPRGKRARLGGAGSRARLGRRAWRRLRRGGRL